MNKSIIGVLGSGWEVLFYVVFFFSSRWLGWESIDRGFSWEFWVFIDFVYLFSYRVLG